MERTLTDEEFGEVWGKVDQLRLSLDRGGFGIDGSTALALRVCAMLCEMPRERREGPVEIDKLINVAYADQQHIRKEH